MFVKEEMNRLSLRKERLARSLLDLLIVQIVLVCVLRAAIGHIFDVHANTLGNELSMDDQFAHVSLSFSFIKCSSAKGCHLMMDEHMKEKLERRERIQDELANNLLFYFSFSFRSHQLLLMERKRKINWRRLCSSWSCNQFFLFKFSFLLLIIDIINEKKIKRKDYNSCPHIIIFLL